MNLILILACIEILFTEIFLVYGVEIPPAVELSCEMVCSFHEAILSCGGKLTDTCTYKGIDLMVFEIPIE